MNIFSVLSMIGGLALFLYGMNVLGDGLAKLAGGRLERVLEKLTKKRYMAVLLGAGRWSGPGGFPHRSWNRCLPPSSGIHSCADEG